jgi:hypothetical protein
LISAATIEQESRVEADDWSALIETWLDGKSPDDFGKDGMRRDATCPAQLWKEAIGGSHDQLTQRDSRRITNIMRRMSGWEPRSKVRLGGAYGPSRGFARMGLA